MKAIIIGGGIGGLTAAIALRRRGIEVNVYEQSPALLEVGAGISLWANALKALALLGLEKELSAIGNQSAAFSLRRWNGDVLSTMPAHELEQRFGAAVTVVHRAELLDILLRSFPGDHLHLGKTCTGIELQADHVIATFSSGETAQADVLIGADGLHSTVRSELGYDNRIRYAGYTAWRSIARFDSTGLDASETWGCGRRFGIHPMTDGRVYWYATTNAPEGERDLDGSSQDWLLTLFKGWMHPIEALIQASDARILRNDIYDRNPLTKWSRGRVTLLGDAAHPMAPDLGQGACQAIEDALELAKSLDSAPGVPASLRRYQAKRIPRTTSIVLASKRMGRVGQLQSPMLCRMRDLAFQLTPLAVSLRTLAPVVGYQRHLGD